MVHLGSTFRKFQNDTFSTYKLIQAYNTTFGRNERPITEYDIDMTPSGARYSPAKLNTTTTVLTDRLGNTPSLQVPFVIFANGNIVDILNSTPRSQTQTKTYITCELFKSKQTCQAIFNQYKNHYRQTNKNLRKNITDFDVKI